MACLRNALGQPLCNVVEHPDRADESFCSTCNQRFKKALPPTQFEPSPTSSTERRLSPIVTDIIIGLLALILTAFINSVIKSDPQFAPPPGTDSTPLNEQL